MSNVAAGTDGLASSKARFLTCAGGSSMSNVAIKFSHAGPSQGALPLAGRGRRIRGLSIGETQLNERGNKNRIRRHEER